jgi:dihydroorotate dehydrogenase (NAD+) catalytic subunit
MKKAEMKINIGKLEFANPVLLASGTCGYGEEIAPLVALDKIGGIVTKTITLNPRAGNPTPRIVETSAGMLNSIGLENKGLTDFINNKAPVLCAYKTKVITSIAGESLEEFCLMAETLSELQCVDAIELNLSCPNVAHSMKGSGCRLTAQDACATEQVVGGVRKKTKKTLITKLTPNVTNIADIAKAAESSGSDAITAINTLFGLSVNIATRRANLAKGCGGLSGPAIKPTALYCVHEIFNNVKIPIIGAGGIFTWKDAVEFILCGATAVQVGTANFVNPNAAVEIVKGLECFISRQKIKNITSLIGTLVI